MGLNIRQHTYPQKVRVWNTTAVSGTLADTTTETSLDAYPKFDVLDRPFAAGDTLDLFFAVILTNNATITMTAAIFWGTQAGTLLVRTGAIELNDVDSAPHLIVQAKLVFWSATTVVPSIMALMGSKATPNYECAAASAVTIAQTANEQPISLALDWSGATVGTAILYQGEAMFSRMPTP